MRYMSTQQLVARLVEKDLGLEYEGFLINDRNIAYPRIWEANRVNGATANGATVAECSSQENLLLGAIERIIGQRVSKLIPEERLQIQQENAWGGRALYDWGFLNLLNRVMSPADYSLVAGPSGLANQTGNWNAADAIFSLLGWMDPVAKHRRPVKGMQEIPHRLAQLFSGHGGMVLPNRELIGCTMDPTGTVKLIFKTQPSHTGHPPIELPPVYARHVVLAMPRRALERIIEQRATDVLAEPAVRRLIASVTPVPAFHLACCYHEPWWERAGEDGAGQRVVAGVPVRQALYLGTEEKSDRESTDRNSLVLLTNDEQTINYWIGLLRQDGRVEDPYKG
ncbi:MAG: FAD-dependent oxidoreductase, partial [Pseudonocardiaceae bacterium]